jgi:hypothetical protein
MNEQLKSQVIDQLKSANNVLVAVSSNPTVDELSASIALTLLLNKMNKHATTVFSGVVPSTIEFLQPDKTIETTTDSLRDFIIALDKSKADKLRYKVEDDVVRIFITPYRTSITDKDLEFSQGDFNVDVVLALGVTRREDLDQAITSHGRILHDATVISLTKREAVSQLGSLNWQEPQASSLCEMVSVISFELDRALIDGQMATALMTGIVAETDRFRNDNTTPLALSLSSQLMSAGANQQLIAQKLEEPKPEPIPNSPTLIQEAPIQEAPATVSAQASEDAGQLEIEHENVVEKIHIDENGTLFPSDEKSPIDEKETLSPAESDQQPTSVEENELVAAAEVPDQTPENNQNSGLHTNADAMPQDESKDLDAPTESIDANDAAAVPSAEHEIPTMTHGKTILPPSYSDTPVSSKPFDLEEALKTEIAKEETNAGTLPSAPQQTATVQSQPINQQDDTQPFDPTTTQPMPALSMQQEPTQLPPAQGESLLALEKSIGSPHFQDPNEEAEDAARQQSIDKMRDSVAKAADAVVSPFPAPSKSLGAQPVDIEPTAQTPDSIPTANTPKVYDGYEAPPVPPPMPLAPQFFDSDGQNDSPLNP